MDIQPQDLEKWLSLLGKPTAGLIAFIVVILYREAIIHGIKAIIDFVFKRK